MGKMKVIYRICDVNSTNPPPIFPDNRPALNELCLKSFVNAFDGIDIDYHFILDKSSDRWPEIISTLCVEAKIETTDLGIDGSARHAVDVALQYDDDIIFQECDYLWVPKSGQLYIDAIKYFGVVSPYDHPDKYPGTCDICTYQGLHWRTAPSTTQTYGISKENLQKHQEIIKKHGYIDQAMWEELAQNGLILRTPIPSIATHMVRDYLAPSIDWETIASFNL